MACVKADAYGHGLERAARALEDLVDGFAVACMEEALGLRAAGINAPLLLLEGPHSRDEVAEAGARGIHLCIVEARQRDWLAATAPAMRPHCWLKIDTGMHRLGFAPAEAPRVAAELAALLDGSPPVLCTHFAAADDPRSAATAEQLACFEEATQDLAGARSCANSAALLTVPASHLDWVRPGYLLYGGNPLRTGSAAEHGLRPAMEVSAAVISLRDVASGDRVGYGGRWQARRPSRIATIAIGYGDGYPRHARDGTPVLVAGSRCPLAGRVSMDMITVDVTDHAAVKIGDRAVLWGENPTVDEVAGCADTIGYELLAGLPARLPRVDAP
jgi:alanine racemase